MGKSSKAQRLRAAQPAAPDKGWCDHCLGVLHDTGNSAVVDAMIEAYRDMRTGFQLDREYSHAEAIEWIESEVGPTLHALKGSGERYSYECDLESRSESGLPPDEWREYVAVRQRLGEITEEQARQWLEAS